MVKQHLRGAIRHTVVAKHRQRTHHLNARRIHGHQNHRLLLVAVLVVRIVFSHEDRNFAARIGGIGGVPLEAVDHVLVTITNNGRGNVGRVTRRHLRFGHGETRADFTG